MIGPLEPGSGDLILELDSAVTVRPRTDVDLDADVGTVEIPTVPAHTFPPPESLGPFESVVQGQLPRQHPPLELSRSRLGEPGLHAVSAGRSSQSPVVAAAFEPSSHII